MLKRNAKFSRLSFLLFILTGHYYASLEALNALAKALARGWGERERCFLSLLHTYRSIKSWTFKFMVSLGAKILIIFTCLLLLLAHWLWWWTKSIIPFPSNFRHYKWWWWCFDTFYSSRSKYHSWWMNNIIMLRMRKELEV